MPNFTHRVRVAFPDTDASGRIHFTAMLRYFESAEIEFLRALGFIAGFHGDKQRGLRTIEDVAQKGTENRVDAEIVLCALYRRENHPGKAVPLVLGLIQKFPRNYIMRLELAVMYAQSGDKTHALEAVGEAARIAAATSFSGRSGLSAQAAMKAAAVPC